MLTHRPVFLFVMIIAPLTCMLFFTSLMREGLPTSLPAAMVDADDTPTTRKLCRVIDAMELTGIRYKYRTFSEAHKAMRRGDIYGFFYISPGTTRQALASRQPRVSFYTNDCYLVPANLLMKELKTSSELISLAIFREKLRAKGVREDDMMAWLQPIAIDCHPIGNPTLNYNVYLSNMVVPGIFILLILITTVYTIGYEWKQRTQRYLYALAEQSQTAAIMGKLMPQTVIYTLQFWVMDWWFFVHCGFPCHCGFGMMLLLGLLTVLASQGFGVLLFGVMAGAMRVALCICCLWGILSFSLAGFTYPVTDMHPVLQALAPWFPLRHYYLIYVNQALDGFPITCVWSSVVWLAAFCVSPLIVNYRYRKAFLQFEYMP
jgi:ABC-2 type transport system permease protein